MVKARLAGTAILLLLLCLPGSAAAEVRTGSAPNPRPEPDKSSPTRPELKRADVRYDAAAGTLTFTLTLYHPLADPSDTSALRPWRLYLTVGDYLDVICTGDRRTWLGISGTLADDRPAVVDVVFDVFDRFPEIIATKTTSPDRTQITVTATHPRLVGLGIICARARIYDARETADESSETSAFLLDGFDAADGALAREAPNYLRHQADQLARRLRPRVGRARLRARCRVQLKTEFACRASGRLVRAAGAPRISLRGELSFDPRAAHSRSRPTWRANMAVAVRWRRCPDFVSKRLGGRPCQRAARWLGGRSLADALGV